MGGADEPKKSTLAQASGDNEPLVSVLPHDEAQDSAQLTARVTDGELMKGQLDARSATAFDIEFVRPLSVTGSVRRLRQALTQGSAVEHSPELISSTRAGV